jgi:hypothetical protein
MKDIKQHTVAIFNKNSETLKTVFYSENTGTVPVLN